MSWIPSNTVAPCGSCHRPPKRETNKNKARTCERSGPDEPHFVTSGQRGHTWYGRSGPDGPRFVASVRGQVGHTLLRAFGARGATLWCERSGPDEPHFVMGVRGHALLRAFGARGATLCYERSGPDGPRFVASVRGQMGHTFVTNVRGQMGHALLRAFGARCATLRFERARPDRWATLCYERSSPDGPRFVDTRSGPEGPPLVTGVRGQMGHALLRAFVASGRGQMGHALLRAFGARCATLRFERARPDRWATLCYERSGPDGPRFVDTRSGPGGPYFVTSARGQMGHALLRAVGARWTTRYYERLGPAGPRYVPSAGDVFFGDCILRCACGPMVPRGARPSDVQVRCSSARCTLTRLVFCGGGGGLPLRRTRRPTVVSLFRGQWMGAIPLQRGSAPTAATTARYTLLPGFWEDKLFTRVWEDSGLSTRVLGDNC